jgi:hypothetical protein
VLESVILFLVVSFVLFFLSGCTTAPPPVPTAEIPVSVPIDCKNPDPGPKPDLTALASLTKDSTPQLTLTVMGAALAALAEDDARLRALMTHGN